MRKYQSYVCFLLVCCGFILNPRLSVAQKDTAVDNGYYVSYPQELMLRVYLSQKFAPFTISAENNELNYKTNSKLNLGIGASYRTFTLNLGYGFSFLNKEKGKGKTTGLDFQLHIYPHKFAIDLIGSFLKGYYLDPKNNKDNGLGLSNFYLRPDVHRDVVGFSAYRVSHSDKFSYRAAFTQNDVQTRSAGSLLFGAEAYYGSIRGDSALVPPKVNSLFKQAGIDKVTFISVGPGIGYAYTLVVGGGFFITASAIGHLDVNFSNEERAGTKNNKVALIPDVVYKGALGYNSSTWSITGNITGNALYASSASSSKEYFLPTGIIRFTIAKRIGLKK